MSLYKRAESTSSSSETDVIWNSIPSKEDIESILQASHKQPQLIYKHSHRCSVCFLAKQQLDALAEQKNDITDFYLINVIGQREVSNAVAEKLNIRHESPQVIIIKDEKVVWKASHWQIKAKEILKALV